MIAGMMTKKQLLALFTCSLVGWTILLSILNLLPVYAVQLGADEALAGHLLALAFAALTAGTLLAGWLSDKFQRRKSMLILAGLSNIPATWLMGQAEAFWQLAILTIIVYFLIGVGAITINILAGLFAGASERGKVFGILAINTSLGALLGGAASGAVVDRWGFPTLFLLACAGWGLQALSSLLLQDRTRAELHQETKFIQPESSGLGRTFYIFMLANLLAFGAGFISVLGRPLLMNELRFDAAAISGVVAIGGAVSLPLPFLFGWLSDRMNRYWLIMICFLANAIGLFVLADSLSLWHFGISAVLLSGTGVSLGIGPALVTDFVSPRRLGQALSWYNFSPSVGGILSFALAGQAFQGFGMSATFFAGALLTLLAAVLVLWVQRAKTQVNHL
jgi:MFS family permease